MKNHIENRASYRLGTEPAMAPRRRPAPAVAWFAALVAIAMFAGSQVRTLPSTRLAVLGQAEDKALPVAEERGLELTPVMTAALDSVAQRYRVAPEALVPIFNTAQSAAKELDPLLVVAVIGVESGFNPIAQSVMGAQGLMQVIPRFHKDKLSESGSEGGLLDPESNVRIGIQILQDAIRRQGGLIEGLQYYGGAMDDPDRAYSARVLAEKQKLEAAIKARRTTGPVPRNASGSSR